MAGVLESELLALPIACVFSVLFGKPSAFSSIGGDGFGSGSSFSSGGSFSSGCDGHPAPAARADDGAAAGGRLSRHA